ncbi:MAG TPA: hypothetical protein VNW52_13445 [Burkholderiaceae bacterium]|jgi:hypothetical protein|nr:hypothetical protein [Burkholderiaceae bacterium]
MRNESDRNLPLIVPMEATMTDYLIAVRVFLLLQSQEHAKSLSLPSMTTGTRPANSAHRPQPFIPAKAA